MTEPTLIERYAGVGLDIDGVLVRAREPVPGAAGVVAELRRRGIPFVLLTNNSRRTPEQVAAHLVEVGVDVSPDAVLTSSQAAVRLLEPGSRCLVIGEAGLRAALRAHGAVEVVEPDDAEAVVVGLDHGLTWDDLRRATLALHRGARFLATNADPAYPAPEGPWPGNGAALAALTAATGRSPEVAGKPAPAMFDEAARRLGSPDDPGRLLMVGDSLRTDIEGASAAGWDTALVLTGTTRREDVSGSPPTWVLEGPAALLEPPPVPARGDDGRVRVRTGTHADVPAVLRLWGQAGMLTYTPQPERDIAAAVAAAPDLFLVAEAAEVVGVLLATSDGRRGWLQRLVVDAAHRGGGIGRRLVGEAERRLVARGVPQVNLLHFADNDAAAAFWARLGYEPMAPIVLRSKRP